MKKENDELNNLFRTRLEDAKMIVRDNFWEELQRDIPAVIFRRRQLIYRFSAAASVLLILVGVSAAFWFLSPKEEIADAFIQVAASTGTKVKIDVVHEKSPAIHAVSPAPVSFNPTVVTNEEYPDEESFSFSISMSYTESSSLSSNSEHRNKTVGNRDRNTLYTAIDDRSTSQQYTTGTLPPSSKNKTVGTWSVGAFVSAGLLSDRVHSPYPVKYKQPFATGLSVRKELSDRWGIESGLVYTQLNSDQTLHYVGIPVKTDLSFYKNKRVNLYASAGGMVEKCVGGDVKPTPLQLSLTTAVGVEYKLSGRLSLYAEPGVSYHFDDGSPVSTIRKEKPLNVNLLCGVRMTY